MDNDKHRAEISRRMIDALEKLNQEFMTKLCRNLTTV